MNTTDTSREMPKYKMNNTDVWALKIKSVEPQKRGDYLLHFCEKGYEPIYVDREFIRTHQPAVMGYYVCDDNGVRCVDEADFLKSVYPKKTVCQGDDGERDLLREELEAFQASDQNMRLVLAKFVSRVESILSTPPGLFILSALDMETYHEAKKAIGQSTPSI